MHAVQGRTDGLRAGTGPLASIVISNNRGGGLLGGSCSERAGKMQAGNDLQDSWVLLGPKRNFLSPGSLCW